jgi:predicted CoA-binding protein
VDFAANPHPGAGSGEVKAMTTQAEIDAFLAPKRFAFVGVSRDSGHFSRVVFREFRKNGLDAIPVRPDAVEIEGVRSFGTLREIEPPVECVLVMLPHDAIAGAAAACIGAGVKRVCFYRGAGGLDDNAIEECRAHRISVIADECPMMFLPNTGWVHRFHGWLRKISGTYPATSRAARPTP